MEFIQEMKKRGIPLINITLLAYGIRISGGQVIPEKIAVSLNELENAIKEQETPNIHGSDTSKWLTICEQCKYCIFI